MNLYIDCETYSETDIGAGTYAYTRACQVMLVTFAVGDGEVRCWDRTADPTMPSDLAVALADPELKAYAHHVSFDRNALKYGAGIEIPIERWRCTMVLAYAHSLPGSLGALSTLFGLGEDAKLEAEGRALVMTFCKPQPANRKIRRRTRETDPEKWARFVDYAKQDIVAMRTLVKRMPRWNWTQNEVDLFHLDQRINERGFAVDLKLANAAIRATDAEQKRLKSRTRELTDDAVASTTQRDVLLEYLLQECGLHLTDLKASTIERALERLELDAVTAELLRTRLQATTTSTSKYKSVLKAVNDDGRLRGTLQFRGAARTGRDAGRQFQPQNLPRPPKHLKKQAIADGIEALKQGIADLLYDNVMELCSAALRGLLVAGKGKKLIVSDLANIEGRGLAWVANETWKIKAFEAYDRGEGPDLYKLTYSRAFVVPVDQVTDDQRQIGKVMELALGYGGGVGAFATMAAGYGFDLDALADQLLETLDAELIAEASDFWDWAVEQKRTLGFSRDTFVAIDALKRAWRRAHPATVRFWKGVDEALVTVTQAPTAVERVGRVVISGEHRGKDLWLRIKLPSGRYLSYPRPQVKNDEWSYEGVHQYTRKWTRIKSYGAKAVENLVQALSCDVLMHGVQRAEEAGYAVVLRVHDELVTEVPDSDQYSVRELARLMTINPPWATGLPLAAEGFEAYRYRK